MLENKTQTGFQKNCVSSFKNYSTNNLLIVHSARKTKANHLHKWFVLLHHVLGNKRVASPLFCFVVICKCERRRNETMIAFSDNFWMAREKPTCHLIEYLHLENRFCFLGLNPTPSFSHLSISFYLSFFLLSQSLFTYLSMFLSFLVIRIVNLFF